MANAVYANDNEIACKAAAGKSICAFPDVCMTPPESPATPPGVPVPYPNTGLASDTTDGSRTVEISGKEVMLKNKSYFKTSYGDEAGCAAKKGVLTSTNRGKVYFIAWSMNVKIEGENADRHLDMTTHNHASPNANEAAPMAYVDKSAFAKLSECTDDKDKMDKACDGKDPCPGVLKSKVGEQRAQMEMEPEERSPDFRKHAALLTSADDKRTTKAAKAATAEAEAKTDGGKCVQASRCYVRRHTPGDKQDGCCPGQTPHHVPPWSCIRDLPSSNRPSYEQAPCVCLEGASQHVGSHGKNHAAIEWLAEEKGFEVDKKYKLSEYIKLCAATIAAQCKCNMTCIEEQLRQRFKDPDNDEIPHRTTNSGAEVPSKLKTDIRKSAAVVANATSSR